MSQTVSLLFGVHAHQPVGNFPEVMEDAHQRCYKPFFETLHRYPEFRAEMLGHIGAGRLSWKEDVVQGLANAPAAFMGLLQGRNLGKLIVALD